MDNEIVEKIKQTARVEDVIGYCLGDLQKDGVNLKCKCPFHEDSHPSLKINLRKNYWHCFPCDKGGDAISFLMEYKGCSFVDALELIAKIYNIDTRSSSCYWMTAQEERYTKAQKRMMYAANYMADDFSKYLFGETGESVLDYLKTDRGFSDETIKAFRLGYASDDDDFHIKNLRREGYNSDDYRNLKILDTNYKDEEYFVFKGRIMFPIMEEKDGRVISFAGRINPNDKNSKTAKYINGKETDVYKKSDVLYGLFQAKDYIKKQGSAYITEGYCDVISMHQKGIKNVVASCGTALTVQQIDLLKSYVPTINGLKHVTVMFDNDAAGMAANLRNGKLLMKAGFNVRLVALPEGEDPDSYCLSHTAKEVQDYLTSNSQSLLKIITDQALERGDSDYSEELEIIRLFLERVNLC